MSTSLLTLRGLTKVFGGLTAVNDLDIQVSPGEIHGLIGPNGSGKSTTLNLISGLYQPTSGHVVFEARDMSRMKPNRRTVLGLARTFQNIRLFKRMSVLGNVMVARYCRTTSGLVKVSLRLPSERAEERRAREDAMIALQVVGIAHRAQDLPGDLPYGQQRLVEIARALATSPKMLLLDEPAAGMNHTEKAELSRLIRRLNEELGCTVLLVEHDMNVVMGCCGNITVLNFGSRIAQGTAAEVRGDPAVIQAYLGTGGTQHARGA